MIGVFIMVGQVGIAARYLLPPVGHAVLISVPASRASLLRVDLPSAFMLGDISFVVNLTFDARF